MSVSSGVVKRGWLQKRGEHIRTWRARYFVLFECGELMGFRAQPGDDFRDPDNRFTVHGCQVMASDKSRHNAFTIRLRGTDVIERQFSADSNEEREEWMSAISSVAVRLRAHSATAPRCAGPRRSRRITMDCFELVKVLGRGTFGKLVLSREKHSGKLYVIKIIKKMQVADAADGHHVLEKTSHLFLAALRYWFRTVGRVCFLMVYVNGGDLLFHLSLEGSFTEERTRFYVAELVSALGYLHDEGIVYPEANISYGRTTSTYCGSPEYRAPEVLAGLDCGPAVDWWGAGVAMYVMVCGRRPFANRAHDTPLRCIINEDVSVAFSSIAPILKKL